MEKKYKEFDHTADVGIRIYGKTLQELFGNAAEGMFAIIGAGKLLTGGSGISTVTESIEVESSDRVSLLKDWLSELLYLHTTTRVYFTQFNLSSVSQNAVSATVAGFPMSSVDMDTFQDIKAVTYHGLEVKQVDNGFEAQVIFDI